MANNLVKPRPGSPAALGYRMPAEWEPHAATWIAWPHNMSDWPGKFEPIPWVMAEIVRHLAHDERVNILVNNAAAEERALKFLRCAHVLPEHESESQRVASHIQFHLYPTNRIWTRDYGPIFVKGGKQRRAALDWRFNAWAKYSDWRRDDAIPKQILSALGVQTWQPTCDVNGKPRRVVLEGGSIDVNGAGTILTTEECLLSDVQARNPELSRSDLEQVFADYLGATKTLWLNRGIAGDDTHGHVDDLARFVNPTTVVVACENHRSDENYEPLIENYKRLQHMTDQAGHALRVVRLPMPDPIWFEGRRLPASYANFYIANKRVLVPVFNCANDLQALNTLAQLFPSRHVVPIYCGDFIWGLGAIHCMTQQQPA
jgi:agmatine deiminase